MQQGMGSPATEHRLPTETSRYMRLMGLKSRTLPLLLQAMQGEPHVCYCSALQSRFAQPVLCPIPVQNQMQLSHMLFVSSDAEVLLTSRAVVSRFHPTGG